MKSFGGQGINMGGFAGRGFFGPLPVKATTITLAPGGPNALPGWAGAPMLGSAQDNFGVFTDGSTNGNTLTTGTINGANPTFLTVKGARIRMLGWVDDTTPAWYFGVALAGTLVQSFFTRVTVSGVNYNLATAAATFFNSNATYAGITGWFWAVANPGGASFGNKTVVFT